jgi:hypothetical protein
MQEIKSAIYACMAILQEDLVIGGELIQEYKLPFTWRADYSSPALYERNGMLYEVRDRLPAVFFAGLFREFGGSVQQIQDATGQDAQELIKIYTELQLDYSRAGTLFKLILTNLKFNHGIERSVSQIL